MAMLMMRLSLSLVLFLCMHQLACAQHQGMQYFTGKWKFEGWSKDMKAAPDFTATWIVEKGLDNAFCLTGHVEFEKSGTFTRELMAYDAVSKMYTRTIIANDGSAFSFTSPGWNKDELIWTGTQYQNGRKVLLSEKISRISEKEFHAIFYRKQDGRWVRMQTERLQRID